MDEPVISGGVTGEGLLGDTVPEPLAPDDGVSERDGPTVAAAPAPALERDAAEGPGRSPQPAERDAERAERQREAAEQERTRARQHDTDLIERARRGELDAFNQLVLGHQDALFGLVYRLVPDRDQAADVVQEAFLHAYRDLRSFRGGSVKSWLSRIAVNAAMDVQRARRRRPSQPYPELEDESWQPPAATEEEPDARALTAERSRLLAAALGSIAWEQRTAIVLYDVEGYDYAEIATMMGISIGTVKSRIHRGRLSLRAILAPARELFRG